MMKFYTLDEVNEIVRLHATGKKADLRNADLGGANFSGAYFGGANFSDADLGGANFSGAYFGGANFSDADLGGANFSGAYLARANLHGANMAHTYLRSATFHYADLSNANLSHADLSCAGLDNADLRGADLTGTTLRDAGLCNARLPIDSAATIALAELSILPAGDIEGWKTCKKNILVRLKIPAAARRSNATGRKCRAEWAQVVEVIGSDHGESLANVRHRITYRAGETVHCDHWDDDWTKECAGGIHFFITRAEAEAYSI